MIISVSHLTRTYRIHQREPGLFGSIRSLFDRKYKKVHAVEDVSFTINEGELIGFIGPNGAGKTTTLKCLSGLLYPTSGTINILGFTPYEKKREYLKRISLVMGQKNQLWWDLPAVDTFLLNKEVYGVTDSQYRKTLGELVELLDVSGLLNVQVRKLSLGQRMKMELIAALIHHPTVLFLDEPTIGLDVVMQQNLRDFIRDYNLRYHATIILTSHYMGDVESLCKRIIMIDHGKKMYDGLLTDMVKRYTTHKRITVILQKPVDPVQFKQFGEVKEFAYPRLVLSVPRDTTSQIASKILDQFPVADLNIEEADIENIVRTVFRGKKPAKHHT